MYLAEFFKISSITSFGQGSPSFLGALVGDIIQVEFAVVFAIHGFVAY